MQKVFCRNLGCRANLADLASVVALLPAEQFQLVGEADSAQLAILNTCTVTHKADSDARKILGALRRERPDLPVIVIGCGVAIHPDVFKKYSNVRGLIPPGDPREVARAIEKLTGMELPAQATGPSPYARLGRHRAVVKVQDGCNSACTYCVVPQARGRERSLPLADAVARVAACLQQGHQEVVLSGIHLGRYAGGGLPALLRALVPVMQRFDPQVRIRLSSIEPLEWTDALLETIGEVGFVCEHFHVPLQSGDDGVLGRMGRPYRAETFCVGIEKLYRRFPASALGTDVLVGFPGESEAAAENTRRLIESLPLCYLHVFTFSPRPQTPAERLPGRVDRQVVARRAATLRALGAQRWGEFLQRALGKTHQVLIEKSSDHGSRGRSRAYHPFSLKDGALFEGQVVEVVARQLEGTTLVGERVGHG